MELRSGRSPFYIWPRLGSNQLTLDSPWELAHLDQPIDPTAPVDLAHLAAADWVQVTAPAMIQWQWYIAGRGPHPYTGEHSRDYRWMEERAWWYRCRFQLPADWHDQRRLDLVFDGVDHDARIWLNGQELGSHVGMFGGPSFDVSHLLDAAGEHELLVRLLPAGRERGIPVRVGDNVQQAGRLIKGESFDRWVNNPDLMTTGIWQPVRLVATGELRMERPQTHVRSLTPAAAAVRVEAEVLAAAIQPVLRSVRRHGSLPPVADPANLVDGPLPTVTLTATVADSTGAVVAQNERHFTPRSGREWVTLDLDIAQPQLWQPNGLGEPYRYAIELTLALEGVTIDRIGLPLGLRTIELHAAAAPRAQDHWRPWLFRINGRDCFIRGINWMPSDLLCFRPEKYRWLLQLARDAGVQLVRVWGGGLVETEAFYDVCDELGLLVWQDFPLNSHWLCSDIPLAAWEAMVAWNVFRLRTRPSLAVWCGGNEFDAYHPDNAAVVGIMERLVNDLDGARPWFRACSDPGDVHPYPDCDTSWYGTLYADTPAVTEWGSHALPTPASMAEFMDVEERGRSLVALTGLDEAGFRASHPALANHWAEFLPERIPRTIRRAALLDDLSDPSLERFAEAVQLGAGEVYASVAERFRANYPVTTLIMPWVYNRPWPSVGMQLVDHSGRPTAGYALLKRAYQPGALDLRYAHEALAPAETLEVTLHALYDAPGGLSAARVVLALYDGALTHLSGQEWIVDLPAGPQATLVADVRLEAPKEPGPFYLRADLYDGTGRLLARSLRWLRVLRELADPTRRAVYRAAPQPSLPLTGLPARALVGGKPTTLRCTLRESDPVTLGPIAAQRVVVHLENSGAHPALFARWLWEHPQWLLAPADDYLWLEPGEQQVLSLTFAPAAGISAWQDIPDGWSDDLLSGLGAAAWNAPATRLARGTDQT